MRWCLSFAVLGALLAAGPANAKKVRYASGPKPAVDTVLSVAEPELEPIVRARGPRVPLTNLQLVTRVANMSYQKALAIAQRLAQGEPDRADYQRDLWISLWRVGGPYNLGRALHVLESLQQTGRMLPGDEPDLIRLREMVKAHGQG